MYSRSLHTNREMLVCNCICTQTAHPALAFSCEGVRFWDEIWIEVVNKSEIEPQTCKTEVNSTNFVCVAYTMLYHRLLAISSVVFENDLMNRFNHPFLPLNKTSTKRITARLFSIDNSLSTYSISFSARTERPRKTLNLPSYRTKQTPSRLS